MNPDYFGDSYDIVKKFFVERLHGIGYKVYADPMLTGEWEDDGAAFLKFIGVKHAEDAPEDGRGIALFIDPDTGVNEKGSIKHCPIGYAADQAGKFSIVFAFDQSFSRAHETASKMQEKLAQLRDMGVNGFYYHSHAPFLFAARDLSHLSQARESFIKSGIPKKRFIGL
ncbi:MULTISPECIES: hypothetical protein [Halorhodospira]|uniref:hypothetical protein n=1 Tax=Halorhodospira TaxID=85108 RepID=UPI001EE8C2F2|nr:MULTISPECIES: hypothetical protein [Halorhodospira]MCG5526834.1 hypothetical protein [Halorhodospira halophila]MCG5542829.1 hypothetical protein [Halorhodospira sp. 9628]